MGKNVFLTEKQNCGTVSLLSQSRHHLWVFSNNPFKDGMDLMNWTIAWLTCIISANSAFQIPILHFSITSLLYEMMFRYSGEHFCISNSTTEFWYRHNSIVYTHMTLARPIFQNNHIGPAQFDPRVISVWNTSTLLKLSPCIKCLSERRPTWRSN